MTTKAATTCIVCGSERVQRRDIPPYKSRTVCARWPACYTSEHTISEAARMSFMGAPLLPGFESATGQQTHARFTDMG